MRTCSATHRRGRACIRAQLALLLAALASLIACGQVTESTQATSTTGDGSTTTASASASSSTTTSTTSLSQLSDAALLSRLQYPPDLAAELAAKAPRRVSFTTAQSATVVLLFRRDFAFDTDAGRAVTQYFEAIRNIRVTLNPLGTGPAVFSVTSDPPVREHVVVLLASEAVPPSAQKRPIAQQPIGGTTLTPTSDLALSVIRARTSEQANEIFAVETGQRILYDELVSAPSGDAATRQRLQDAGREQIINSLGVAISRGQLGSRYPVGGKFSFPDGLTLTYIPLSEFPGELPKARVIS